MHELLPIIESLQNSEIKDVILKWYTSESKKVAKGHYAIHWRGLVDIIDKLPELKKQLQEACPEFDDYLERNKGTSAHSVAQITRAKVFTPDEERAILMANPFYGPLLQALEARKNGKNGQ